MSNDTLPSSDGTSDFLTVEEINRCVRVMLPGHRRARQKAGRGLTLVVLSVASMIVGMSAREITHWALGDYNMDPYASVRGYGTDQFRCGVGEIPRWDGSDSGLPLERSGPGSASHDWAATDTPDALPGPRP